jgi:hypothetical protein
MEDVQDSFPFPEMGQCWDAERTSTGPGHVLVAGDRFIQTARGMNKLYEIQTFVNCSRAAGDRGSPRHALTTTSLPR